jgi:hypothetical protein
VWIEVLQNVAVFEKEGDRVVRLVLGVGDHMFAANRVGP